MNDLRTLASLIRRRLSDVSPLGLLRTFPASILLVVVILFCGLLTWGQTMAQYRPLLNRFGLDYEIMEDAHVWRMLTPLFIQPAPGIGWRMVLLVACACVSCELLAGSVRLLVTFFLSDWCATVLTSFALAILSRLDVERATAAIHVTDAGTSAAALGTLAAAGSLLLPPRLAIVAYGALFVIVTTVAAMDLDEFGPAVVHIMAVIVGGLVGRFLWRPQIYPAAFDSQRGHVGSMARVTD